MSGGPDGVTRWAVVLADAGAAAAAPPGIDGRAFALAMCEDVIELVGELSIVHPAVLTVSRGDLSWAADVRDLCWPGTPVADAAKVAGGAAVLAGLAFAARGGADAAAVVAGDAPDLPGLLLGKLFRALGSAEVAVSTSGAGELVALAARLPAPAWLSAEVAGLDAGSADAAADPVSGLTAAAGEARRVATGPPWHRLRAPADVRLLDPGLEGWASTRALLSVPTRQ
jgi:hypothetical protein